MDTGLSCQWWCDRDAVARAGVEIPRNAADARVLGSVLANAVLARQVGQAVSYSRSKSWYAVRERYDGLAFTHGRVTGTVDRLVEQGILGGTRALPGAHVRPLTRPCEHLEALRAEGVQTGLRSTFWASDELMVAFEGARFHHHHLSESAVIRLRDADGNDIPCPETRWVQRERARVAELNEAMRRIRVTFPDAVAVGDHLVMGDAVFRPTDPEVYRVYGRGTFTAGGRAYGWWQNLPKAVRLSMRLDGEDVVEPDFACLHPRILYARRGIELAPDHDAYAVGDTCTRDQAKLALAVGLNARSVPGAIEALARKPAYAGHDRAYAARALDAVRQANPAIADDFGRDLGVGLMNVDARIMTGVLTSCMKVGIPALPVHDSVLTQARHGATVAGIMGEESTRVLGANSRVPVKGYTRFDLHMPSSSSSPPPSPLVGTPGEACPETNMETPRQVRRGGRGVVSLSKARSTRDLSQTFPEASISIARWTVPSPPPGASPGTSYVVVGGEARVLSGRYAHVAARRKGLPIYVVPTPEEPDMPLPPDNWMDDLPPFVPASPPRTGLSALQRLDDEPVPCGRRIRGTRTYPPGADTLSTLLERRMREVGMDPDDPGTWSRPSVSKPPCRRRRHSPKLVARPDAA